MKTAPLLSAAAVSALHRGDKIESIKITREERNTGLKEAKDAVDEYVRIHPMLQTSLAATQAQVKRRVLLWFALLLGLAFLAYHFFSSREAWRFVLMLAGAYGLPDLCH